MTSRLRSSAEVLGPADHARWQVLGDALSVVLSGPAFTRALPAAVAAWSDVERRAWLDAATTLAARDPQAAIPLYRDLPPTLALASPLRATLLHALVPAAGAAPIPELRALLPVLGALGLAIPERAHGIAVALLESVAARLPAAVPGLIRALSTIVDEAPAERVRAWAARGLALGDESVDAGRAYFALASRTSQRVLRDSTTAVTFDEVRPALERYVHMLSGVPATAHAEGGFRLRAPWSGELTGVALPATVDVFATWEDNARCYRLLAAFAAGQREFGTFASSDVGARLAAAGTTLVECFRLADGYRVGRRLAATYRGVAADVAWAIGTLLARADAATHDDPGRLLDALLAAALASIPPPPWLAAITALVRPVLAPLAAPTATAADALAAADTLVALFTAVAAAGELLPAAAMRLAVDGGDGPAGGEAALGTGPGGLFDPEPLPPDVEVPRIPGDAAPGSGGRAPTAEELARLAVSGVRTAAGGADDAGGAFVTTLLGKLVDARIAGATAGVGPATDAARTAAAGTQATVFLYDEWDHLIADYRPAWCRLAELDVPDDAGVFFTSALARHAALVPEVRRHFQRVRPEAYRPVRGLEDGCDIDLVAAIDARTDHRAGRPPSTKLYTARVRQERELATLFLLDMSASTDETVRAGAEDRHIIDVAKEALVVMAAALEEIGDAYAIYGFSGQGRHQVEFYRVKAFDERLVPCRGRLGGIRPRGSTRMGTAVRHAVHTMRHVRARARHLILLSDGFPQDLDYGEDRTSHVYGLRDTAVALREAETAGIRPFCITVDLAGHDYLREMCDPDRYCVIERVADLARELPGVYERVVRAG